ncbi:hypothetical protein BV25DRAFT_776918 [Artomyces pyxidatus]|uniref:Uncharacterized protein n=1 Tax=Artomyces pyxidatus TaxID=48021 RepID=A0ACB8SZ19_9AGAM|nr:hypothetical protein BV25DRAFT_776918 [Artomyces pyxidatus]
MPAPASESFVYNPDMRSLNHVNLMVDTFIANANVEDLRATIRTLLATTPPSTAHAFTRAARSRLSNANASSLPPSLPLFTTSASLSNLHSNSGPEPVPTSGLHDALAHARCLYGAGMGLAALRIFAAIVRVTLGMRWSPMGPTSDVLSLIDAEICQAIQSSKEEIDAGRGEGSSVVELRALLQESERDVEGWGGDFPFERALGSLECWKI